MSNANPVPVTDVDGNICTVVDIVKDYILTVTPGALPGQVATTYNRDTQGTVRFLEEFALPPQETFGTPVAVESSRLVLTVRDPAMRAAKNEIMRLRYLIASLHDYTSRGLTMLSAQPDGGVEYIGKDTQSRVAFTMSFTTLWTPAYV